MGAVMTQYAEQHFRTVENLIFEWARAIDENRVEAICDLLLATGDY
jgi:anthranilate 1,2-dioxygenase small subunit